MKPIAGLQDIQGLDHIGIWPLAIGWWILMALVLIAFTAVAVLHIRRQLKLRSWQHRILKQLESLDQNLTPASSQSSAIQISRLIRRLAIRRFSREECASLKGNEWLNWLTQKDSKKFDWINSAHFIVQAPFSPQGTVFDTGLLKQTIKATKGWVK